MSRVLTLSLFLFLGGCSDEAPTSITTIINIGEPVSEAPDLFEMGLEIADGLEFDHAISDLDANISEIEISSLIAVENPANVLSFYVEWQTSVPAETELEVVCGEEIQNSYYDAALVTEHSVFVMGLIAEISCVMTATARRGEEVMTDAVIIDSVGPLPSDFPEFLVTVHDEEKMQEGWTMLNLSILIPGSFQVEPTIIAFLDEEGRYRWYYQLVGATIPGAGYDSDVVPDGLLISGRHDSPPASVVGWNGTILWQSPFLDNHHEISVSPFGQHELLYLGVDDDCPRDFEEGTVNRFDFDTQETIYTWSLCESYVPPRYIFDWGHLNTIEPVPGEEAVLISSRNQNQIYKVNLETGDIEWALGENGDFEIDPEAYFYAQHGPEIQEDGNIMIFDNGDSELRPYSRGVEYELTFTDSGEPERAEIVWEYPSYSVGDVLLFAIAMSDIDRLDNGNRMITFASTSIDDGAQIFELAGEDLVWELNAEPYWTVYRSERMLPPSWGYTGSGPDVNALNLWD